MPRKFKIRRRLGGARVIKRVKRLYARATGKPRRTGKGKMRGSLKGYSGLTPFPPTYFAKMRYVETFSLATGVAGVFGTSVKMNLNSLYDPNNSGGGHQPYGFDQIKALYAKYLVSGVKVHITFTNPNDDGMVVAVMAQSSTGVGSPTGITADIIKEQPLSWTRPINNSGSQVVHFNQYIPLQRIEGLKKVQWIANQSQYGAAVTANPSLMPSITIAAGSDAGSGAAAVTARVELIFYSRFYDRILQAYS